MWFPRFPRTRFKPSETPALPFNSSPQEVGRLKLLRGHPQWEALAALLERVAQAEYDRLAQALPYEEYLTQCGAYQSARRTVDLVDTLIEKADAIHARERDDTQYGRDHRRSIFFGSHLWNS